MTNDDTRAFTIEIRDPDNPEDRGRVIRECESHAAEELGAEVYTGRTDERVTGRDSPGEWLRDALPRSTTLVGWFILSGVFVAAAMWLQPWGATEATVTPIGVILLQVAALGLAYVFEWVGRHPPVGSPRGGRDA